MRVVSKDSFYDVMISLPLVCFPPEAKGRRTPVGMEARMSSSHRLTYCHFHLVGSVVIFSRTAYSLRIRTTSTRSKRDEETVIHHHTSACGSVYMRCERKVLTVSVRTVGHHLVSLHLLVSSLSRLFLSGMEAGCVKGWDKEVTSGQGIVSFSRTTSRLDRSSVVTSWRYCNSLLYTRPSWIHAWGEPRGRKLDGRVTVSEAHRVSLQPSYLHASGKPEGSQRRLLRDESLYPLYLRPAGQVQRIHMLHFLPSPFPYPLDRPAGASE